MITLQAINLRWMSDGDGSRNDQCAHGLCSFMADDVKFVVPDDGEWTLSATALYLLRTLEFNHQVEAKVAESNFLFPCCAFTAWVDNGKFPVVCCGCPSGLDVWVKHQGDEIELSSDKGTCIVSRKDWTNAVTQFADQITSFYAENAPKEHIVDDGDREGWAAFWNEYNQRRSAA